MDLIDPKFELDPLPYVLQTGLAGLFMIFILAVFNTVTETALIAALASSAFLAYSVPESHSTEPRPLLGGYIVGISVGVLFTIILYSPYTYLIIHGIAGVHGINRVIGSMESAGVLHQVTSYTLVFAFMSFMSAAFIMVATDTEHAPAAGIAVGLVINPWNIGTILFIFAGILFIAGSKRLFERWMMDLI